MTIPDRFAEALFLSPDDVATLARITRRQVLDLCRQKKLRSFRVNRKTVRIEAESVWEWLGVDCERIEPESEMVHPETKELLAYLTPGPLR